MIKFQLSNYHFQIENLYFKCFSFKLYIRRVSSLLHYSTWLGDNNWAKCFPKMPKVLNFCEAGNFRNLQLITVKLFKFAVSGAVQTFVKTTYHLISFGNTKKQVKFIWLNIRKGTRLLSTASLFFLIFLTRELTMNL